MLQEELNTILQAVTGAATPGDELALLRVSLRKWAEGMPPAEAVAWAAENLSLSLSKFTL